MSVPESGPSPVGDWVTRWMMEAVLRQALHDLGRGVHVEMLRGRLLQALAVDQQRP